MNLYDFEEQIPNRILERGYEYWLEDRVFIESEQEATYHLTAEGSAEYEVVITLSGVDIVNSSCDCPYTKGRCKHEVAAYFVLREEVAAPSRIDLKQQLLQLDKQELINILMGLANDSHLYPRIARAFEHRSHSFDQVMKEMRWRFNESFPLVELDYSSLSRFQSFVAVRVSDVLIVQNPESRLKQGIALIIGMSDYEFEELSEMMWEVANELEPAIFSAIDMLSDEPDDTIFLDLLDVLKSMETWNWRDLHLEILQLLTFAMSDGLSILHAYVEAYRDTRAEDDELEDIEPLLRILEKRMDS